MSPKRRGLLVSAALFSALLSGCSPRLSAVVTDRFGQHREITSVTTSKGEKLEILDGAAFRTIPLTKVQCLLIAPTPTQSRDGELYYSTELWLTDSSKVLSYLLPDGNRTEAFVNITPALTGKTSGGTYKMPLKDIRQVRFQIVKRSFFPFNK